MVRIRGQCCGRWGPNGSKDNQANSEDVAVWLGSQSGIHVRSTHPGGAAVRIPGYSIPALGVLASAIAAALGTAQPTPAQEGELEEVVVTGSRIVRRDFEANSPIMTVEPSRFEESSTVAIESVVNQLPQFVPAASQFEPDGDGTGGYSAGSTRTPGASMVSLRGLGSNRNLVLLDGRRAMPVNATGAVNTNNIPAAALARVETITGGASSVYGADAIAGVVNFVLKRDFEGLTARRAVRQHGRRRRRRATSLGTVRVESPRRTRQHHARPRDEHARTLAEGGPRVLSQGVRG